MKLQYYLKKREITIKDYKILKREAARLEALDNKIRHKISVIERIMLRALFTSK